MTITASTSPQNTALSSRWRLLFRLLVVIAPQTITYFSIFALALRAEKFLGHFPRMLYDPIPINHFEDAVFDALYRLARAGLNFSGWLFLPLLVLSVYFASKEARGGWVFPVAFFSAWLPFVIDMRGAVVWFFG